MPEDHFGERVAGATTSRPPRCSTPRWSIRRSTSSPTWPATAPRSSSASAPAGSRCRSPQRGVRVHGIDLSEAMVARLRAKPGGDAIDVTIGDFATTQGRRDVLARLPRLQHDQQPDHAGRAGRVLPERRGAPRARRLLRDRGGRSAAPAASARRDGPPVRRQPDHARLRRVRRRDAGADLPPLLGRRTARGRPRRSRSATSGPPSST